MKKEEKRRNWWKIAFIILIILLVLGFFTSDYKECVEDCADDLEYCLSDVYSIYDAESCGYDLNSCIRWCD